MPWLRESVPAAEWICFAGNNGPAGASMETM